MVIWSYGYQDKTAPGEELRRLVILNGIETVVDVRRLGSSRRVEWNGLAVREALAGACEYQGIPALGNRENMDPGHGKAWQPLHQGKADEALAALVQRVREGERICLLCMEPEPMRCHRWEIARRVRAETGCEVRHLR